MNTTILLVGHGSRHVAGNHEIEAFAHAWRQRHPDWVIELCFIEFADVLLEQGLDNAATHQQPVVVVPLILNAAGHVKMEIPAHIEAARTRHPNIQFIYARHLGANNAILSILKRRLRTAIQALEVPDPITTGVIVLGRGSSDRMANGEVAKIARWLYEESDHEHVDIAFTGITHPRLERVVQDQSRLGMMQIVILPYYLFTGTLIERIKKQLQRLEQQYPMISFNLANYFGFENEIYQLLEKNVRTILDNTRKPHSMMECDGCEYRSYAEVKHLQTHNHHHDHEHHPSTHDHHGAEI